jgi:phosphate transport system substrate-binding protein
MRKAFFVVSVSILLLCMGCGKKEDTGNVPGMKGTISMSGAWALYPMAVTWAEEFMKLHPGLRIDVSAGGAGKGMADSLSGVVDIGNVSREIFPAEIEKGAWWVSVVKDAVVPTFNEKNPYCEDILRRGITREDFRDIWINGKITSWGDLLGKPDDTMISVYTRSDACGAAQTWAQYLDGNQDDLTGIGVYGDPGLAEAVKKDRYGIGFNNVNYAYDSKSRNPVEGLRIIPLDLNADKKIDPDENCYTNRATIIRAISEGVYPSPPARLLHFVCYHRPEKPSVKAFIQWVLSEGQKYVEEAGYIPVDEQTIKEGLQKLDE